MLLKWRLKFRNFIKKNKNKIFFVVIIWLIVIAINFLLGHSKKEPVLNTTYTPHEVVVKSDYEVPNKLKNPIEDLIDDYVTKCNNKEFSKAYALLTDDCKKNVFGDSEEKFAEYANLVFPHKKRYSIQNYSNHGDYYIYNIKIIDDIITTGLTGEEYAYYEEKIAIKQNGDKLQLCVNDYMGFEDLKKIAEDDYFKIRIENKIKYYGTEIYSIKITNKTEKTAVLFDSVVGNEIFLNTGSDNRAPIEVSSEIVLEPGETKTFKLTFQKYYDEGIQSVNLIFNKIRIMNEYTRKEESEEEELSKAEKVYSLSIPIQ